MQRLHVQPRCVFHQRHNFTHSVINAVPGNDVHVYPAVFVLKWTVLNRQCKRFASVREIIHHEVVIKRDQTIELKYLKAITWNCLSKFCITVFMLHKSRFWNWISVSLTSGKLTLCLDVTVIHHILFCNMHCKLAAHSLTDDPKPVEWAYYTAK